MPRSLDFVGLKRLLKVFKELKVLGLKPSWKQFSKEGEPPGQGNSRVPLVTQTVLITSGSYVVRESHRASEEPINDSMSHLNP